VQVLDYPENLDVNTMVLLVCKRDVINKNYCPKVEMKFNYPGKFPTIPDLIQACRVHFDASADEKISLAKYVPH